MRPPSYQNLDSNPNLPTLRSWLEEQRWIDFYRPKDISRGKSYHRNDMLRELSLAPDFETSGKILATVSGSRATPYKVTLTFRQHRSQGVTYILPDSNCSCPVGYNCKHSVTALLKLGEIASTPDFPTDHGSKLSHGARQWLESIQSTSTTQTTEKTPQSNSFLAYCIERDWDNQFTLRLHRAHQTKNRLNISDSCARIDLVKPPSYVREHDHSLILWFAQACLNQWDQQLQLHNPSAAKILTAALKLGTLFISLDEPDYQHRTKTYRKIQSAPAIPVEPGWQDNPDGSVSPVLRQTSTGTRLASGTTLILPTQPPLCLNTATPSLATLETQLPPALISAWTRGPALSREEAETASEKLTELSPENPLPTPVTLEIKRLPKSKPTPHLHIKRAADGAAEGDIIARLSFHYKSSGPLPPLAPGAPHIHAWTKNKVRYLLERNPTAESSCVRKLEDADIIPAESLFPYDPVPHELRHHFIASPFSTESVLTWLDFLEIAAPKLRKNGWTIEVDPDAGLTLFEVSDFQPDIHPETDHGIDWFKFDLHVEIDGKPVSLIPSIAEAIANDYFGKTDQTTELPEHTLIPLPPPDQGFIKFPTERLREICNTVSHLFHGRTDFSDGPLRLDRLSAAVVAGELDIDGSETNKALAELGKKLANIRQLPEFAPPSTLKAKLRPYQLEGYRWLRFLSDNKLNGILADDMGLGKTIQTLAHLAAARKKDTPPALVVAPTSVATNWAAEAARFTPSLKTHLHHGTGRHARAAEIPTADIVITSYPLLVRDREALAAQPWNTVVLDEAQSIKNPKTAAAKAACELQAGNRLCLSGTPMENHLGELWSLMRFLMPGYLSDEKTFNSKLRRPIERHGDADAQTALNRRVSPLLLRRTKDEVATDLPPKTQILHRVTLGTKERELYESVRSLMDKRVRDAIASRGLAKSHIIVLDALLKLRQICCHPSLLKTPAANKLEQAAKFHFLTNELLPTLIEENRRILLFSSFTSVLSLIEKDLKQRQTPHLKLTGQTRKRGELVTRFQSGGIPVFLISLKAGGTGLNLTAADTVIHYDPWWNPAAENQATDRAHRIGQEKPVFVH
ncbi:MAG: SNF2-related protein, partial [Verrucomicrobiales bacterium]